MIFRVSEPAKPAFQLRKGEEGLSAFDTELLQPPLTADEVLAAFRPGSLVVIRSKLEIEAKGLTLVGVEGGESLPDRVREAHVEIRPGAAMTRGQFKAILQELE